MDVVRLVKLHEGFRASPYLDTRGVSTVGYGQRVDEMVLTERAAAEMLEKRIDEDRAALSEFPWFLDLSEVRRAVLLDMAYQLGVEGLLKFTRMIFALRVGDFKGARTEMLSSEWATQTPQRAAQLAIMLQTDAWPK